MAEGIVGGTSWRRKLLAFTLIAVILVCSAMLVFVTLSKSWTVALQVVSAVSGAALGSLLQVDSARKTIENQSRSAIRRLFDQATRLNLLVQRVERQTTALRRVSTSAVSGTEQAAEWLDAVSFNLRNEINTTATAIEDWGDLSRPIYTSELDRYRARHERMPDSPSSGGPTE